MVVSSSHEAVVDSVRRAHAGGWGPMSTGQKIAAALVLDRHDWLNEMGYTMAGAIARLDADWLRAIYQSPRRILEDAGIHLKEPART